ncbi:hypothetical protein B0A48_13212 [Cryoendolithus antarcticus]|uniref:ABM domain-containing protein n=1 Tax=Cryoendolithus antarcticus TaxID=1507870 RepID=A0A1V8SP20_9PEZI|nr:hypothetical protein B0A48_13212 [Cryoendolithus antarcticus]
MYIICPTSNVGSPEKRDRFLSLLSNVAETTLSSETDARAYAWFRSAADNDKVPHHWVQGFEVYDHLEASTVTHRSSDAYKAFRSAVGAEGLLDRGSDLGYLQPTGFGFLIREPVIFQSGSQPNGGYVVVERMRAAGGSSGRVALLEVLRTVAESVGKASLVDAVASFWVLEYRPEDQDLTIVVFQRFESKRAYEEAFLRDSKIERLR